MRSRIKSFSTILFCTGFVDLINLTLVFATSVAFTTGVTQDASHPTISYHNLYHYNKNEYKCFTNILIIDIHACHQPINHASF